MTSPSGRSGHAPAGRRRASAAIRVTTSSAASPLVSSVIASAAGRSGLCSRVRVALVAQTLLGEHDRLLSAELVGASPRAHARVRGEEDLQLGVRRDDRADVAALGDPVAVGEQLALLGHERRAHAGISGDARGRV